MDQIKNQLSVEEFEIIANPPNCGVYHLQLCGNKYFFPKVKKYENYNHNFQFKLYDTDTSP